MPPGPKPTKKNPMTTEPNQNTRPAAWTDAKLLRSAVRTLNDQHVRTSAGFYGLGSRFFRARSVAGVLEVFDFETWTPVSQADAKFHDHNGRDLPLA